MKNKGLNFVLLMLLSVLLFSCGPEKLTKTYELKYFGLKLDLPEKWDWEDGKVDHSIPIYSIQSSDGKRAFHTDKVSESACPDNLEMVKKAIPSIDGFEKITQEYTIPNGFGVTYTTKGKEKTYNNYLFYIKIDGKCMKVYNNIYNNKSKFWETELEVIKSIRK